MLSVSCARIAIHTRPAGACLNMSSIPLTSAACISPDGARQPAKRASIIRQVHIGFRCTELAATAPAQSIKLDLQYNYELQNRTPRQFPCRLAAGIQGLYLLHYLATLVRKFGAHGAHREPDGAGDNDRTWRKRFFVLEPGPTPVLLSYRSPGEPAANTVALQGGHVAVSHPPAHSPL